MKKNLLGLSVIAMTTLALSGTAAGSDVAAGSDTNVNVNFTAYLTETTCDMKLVGGTGSDTKQTLKIGDSNGEVRLESVVAGTATAKFKIAIVECPASLQSLKTTVKGTPASAMVTGLVNQITVANGGANWAAVTVARESKPEAPFKINSTTDSERLVWTATEITNKEVPLVATLRETSAGKMTLGTFQAVATFEFTYE
ncbi:fimbrial protein [Enterobacter soli]|uniref:fimbrial protein n=1 Tax=Enterobacter soli TaxID=885040 RepID=UPI0021489E56|nr:fimbrial protein [Enterobacter soli]MCR1318129.1 fimbrial protein [Enterobacter soli]HDR2473410.1 fimbrial protein [Enterobacter soli]